MLKRQLGVGSSEVGPKDFVSTEFLGEADAAVLWTL